MLNRFKISVIFAVLFVAGVFMGSIVSGFLSAEKCYEMISPFAVQCKKQRADVFISAFLYSVRPLIFMWIFGFTGISFYCCGTALLYRGSVLGLVAGGLIRIYGAANGCILILSGILPHNIIYIPLLIYAASVIFIYSRNRKYINLKSFLFFACILIIGSLITSLCDSVITYDLLNRGIKSVTNG